MIDTQVKVMATASQEVLFQCHMDEEAKAYEFAQNMEKMGVEVTIDIPSVAQTLASSLGIEEQDWEEYQRSMEREIDDHDCSSICSDAND